MLRDHGQPHDAYFAQLNRLLREQGAGRPAMLLDLGRLNHNLTRLKADLPAHLALRIVNKSLPSPKLLQQVLKATQTRRQMVFHEPFLRQTVLHFPDAEVLMGKPLPVKAAENFYRHSTQSGFEPSRQLDWLIDTTERLQQYLQLAQTLGQKLRVNLEIDIGLHRGGFATPQALQPALNLITEHPQHLQFTGFMGYDAHVGSLPRWLEPPQQSLSKSQSAYRAFVAYLNQQFPQLVSPKLVFNGAGSPTFLLHRQDSPVNEVAVGSLLLKPLDFDTSLLSQYRPALFIATPVIKALEGTVLPGLERFAERFSQFNPNWQRTYFIYGGRWTAQPVSPQGLSENRLYGKSFNQAILNGSRRTALAPDDHVFLRPVQSESLMLQFGRVWVIQEGQVVETWEVFGED